MRKSVTVKKTAIIATGAVLAFSYGTGASAQLEKKDVSSVMGYYIMEDCSALIMEGKIYRLTPDKGSELVAESYEVYGDKGRQVIVTDDFTAALIEQPQKGKTETGGVSCALYTDFKGVEPEYEFQEGKETEIDEYVFDNDYMVVTREPLASFFGVDATGLGQTEGSGFSSPEEAVYYYVDGLKNGSLSQMLAAHAVETYVERYQLDKEIERTGGYSSLYGSNFVPNVSDLSRGLNEIKRKWDITERTRRNYLILTGSKSFNPDSNDRISMKDYGEDMTGELLIADLFSADDTSILETIEYRGTIDPDDLEDEIVSVKDYQKDYQERYLWAKEQYGADEVKGLAAYVTVGKRHFVLCFDTVCYDGRWYLLDIGGMSVSKFDIGPSNLGIAELEKEEIAQMKPLIIPYAP